VVLRLVSQCVQVGVKHGGLLVSCALFFVGFALALVDVAGLELALSNAPPSPCFYYAEAKWPLFDFVHQ